MNVALASRPLNHIAIFDTRPQHAALSESLNAALARVISSGSFILGNEVSTFERRCATQLGAAHAIGVSSGSDALFLALTALGIGPGDEVITTAFTFVATAEAILRTGATPVFADIDPAHFGLCPDSTRRMLSPKTRAVLYVHLYGNPGAVAEHARLCKDNGLLLIEDACQAFGARLDSRHAGTWGAVGCYSFFPTKPLGALGDGGLCVTDDSRLAERLRLLRVHGLSRDGQWELVGGNFRLDALQAALLSEKLGLVEGWRIERARLAARYRDALQTCRHVELPWVPPDTAAPAWSLYTVRVARGREGLQRHLNDLDIESRVYYPANLANHATVVDRCRCDTLLETVRASREVLSIPIYFGLTNEQQQRIIEAIVTWDGAN